MPCFVFIPERGNGNIKNVISSSCGLAPRLASNIALIFNIYIQVR